MDNLEYSQDALEIKGSFYGKNYTVYVEGDDDVMFWTKLFELANVDAHIEEVGGCGEIKKLITDIHDNDASFIVACDADHSDFGSSFYNHKQVIKTYGYSIENSMYYINNIENAIQKLGRKPKSLAEEIENWTLTFSNNLFDLLVYDVANSIYNKGVRIFGDNCQRFLKNNSSIEICNNQINKYIASVKNNFTEEEIKKTRRLITKSKKNLWFHLKGHFITHGVINLIQYHVKKISNTKCSLTLDSLYALTVDCSQNWDNRIDIKTVVRKIEQLKKIA